jgi:hypothetical protein
MGPCVRLRLRHSHVHFLLTCPWSFNCAVLDYLLACLGTGTEEANVIVYKRSGLSHAPTYTSVIVCRLDGR